MTMKLGSETGSVMNHIMSTGEQKTPEVGDAATILMWTDRKACTVIELHPNKKGVVKEIVIQEDTVTRTDKNGMSDSQSYTYSPNPEGQKRTCRLLKAGWKIFEGKDWDNKNIYTSNVRIGYRSHYFDYGF